MTNEMKAEIVRYCENGIAEEQEWLENGPQKLKRQYRIKDDFVEKEIEHHKQKLAAYETAKKILVGEDNVSTGEAKSTYDFWKESTAHCQYVLRFNTNVSTNHAVRSIEFFRLASLMKEYLKNSAPDTLVAEDKEIEDESGNENQQEVRHFKKTWDLNTEIEEYRKAIKNARESLDFVENELNRLIAAMAEE